MSQSMAVVAAIPIHGPFTTQINSFGNVQKLRIIDLKIRCDLTIASCGSATFKNAEISLPEL